MHDTPATGQRDVRQHENTERMTSPTVDARVLVDVFKDSHDFVLLLDERGYITYASHSARRLFQKGSTRMPGWPLLGNKMRTKE